MVALRHLFDWMVIGQIMPVNPADFVGFGPRHRAVSQPEVRLDAAGSCSRRCSPFSVTANQAAQIPQCALSQGKRFGQIPRQHLIEVVVTIDQTWEQDVTAEVEHPIGGAGQL
jgi:hypothetical protein